MKEITLTQGQVMLVDDEDYEELVQYKWSLSKRPNLSYAGRRVSLGDGRQTTIYAHRQIMGLEGGDRRQVDHINFNGLDNRRKNLRVVTAQQNTWHQRKAKGYTVDKWGNFQVQIMVDGQNLYLGLFKTEKQAIAASSAAKEKYHKIAS